MNVRITIDKSKEPIYFNIRPLSPRERYGLMGIDGEYLNKLLSCSELTIKDHICLSGNSIVTNCLENIYTKIGEVIDFGETTNFVTLCSGYDSQIIAYEKYLNKKYCNTRNVDLIAWSDCNPFSREPLEKQPAVIAHNLLFPQWKERNVGDMTKYNWDILRDKLGGKEIDILTYSTPCQSISIAGNKTGMIKGSGTKSSILFYTENAIKSLRPKVLIQENVDAILFKKNEDSFKEWCDILEHYDYTNYYIVLDAKNYGIPHTRKRMFMVSFRNDLCVSKFEFPQPIELSMSFNDLEDFDDVHTISEKRFNNYFTKFGVVENEFYVYGIDHKLSDAEIDKYIQEFLSNKDNNNIVQHQESFLRVGDDGALNAIRINDGINYELKKCESHEIINTAFPSYFKGRKSRVINRHNGKIISPTLTLVDTLCVYTKID